MVEAKNENIIGGIPQCLAGMVAAQHYNAQQAQPLDPIFGIVTSGTIWRFLKLQGTQAFVDAVEYPIQIPQKIYGILSFMTIPQ